MEHKFLNLSQYSYKVSPESCWTPHILFRIAIVLDAGKNFSKNNLFISTQQVIEPGGREYNQSLATPTKEKKAHNLISSFVMPCGFMVKKPHGTLVGVGWGLLQLSHGILARDG